MSNWSFDTAERLMRRAEAVIALSEKYRGDLSAVGVDVSEAMEAEYESAPMLSTIEESLDAYDQAAQDAAALRERQETRSPLRRLGLIGVQLPDPGNPVAAEDAEDAAAVIVSANAALDNAAERGVAIVAAMLLLLAVGVVFALRRRRTRTVVEPDPSA